jgi:50S ribosomal subunit-associated GTPase HflX
MWNEKEKLQSELSELLSKTVAFFRRLNTRIAEAFQLSTSESEKEDYIIL